MSATTDYITQGMATAGAAVLGDAARYTSYEDLAIAVWLAMAKALCDAMQGKSPDGEFVNANRMLGS